MYLEKIINVRENIKDTVIKTPLLYSNVFSKISNNNVYMKCENLQLTGAYKIRGALNKILSLSEEEKSNRIHNVLLEVTVETNGHENIQKILNSFKEYNYQINVMY